MRRAAGGSDQRDCGEGVLGADFAGSFLCCADDGSGKGVRVGRCVRHHASGVGGGDRGESEPAFMGEVRGGGGEKAERRASKVFVCRKSILLHLQ